MKTTKERFKELVRLASDRELFEFYQLYKNVHDDDDLYELRRIVLEEQLRRIKRFL